jgi:hypothetical protein
MPPPLANVSLLKLLNVVRVYIYSHLLIRSANEPTIYCIRGDLNSIIGPGQINALGPLRTQPLTGIKM